MKTSEVVSRPLVGCQLNVDRTFDSRGARKRSHLLQRMCRAWMKDVRGGALVETAVSLPVILLLMTGIFSFGIALYQKLALAEAVSAGGRVLAAERGDTDPCQTTTNAIYGAAPTLSRSNLTISYVLNGVAVGTGVTTCSGTTNLVNGGTAQIIATYPTTIGVYGKNWGSFNLGTQITEVVQ